VNSREVESAIRIAKELKKKPEDWGWKITGVLIGHGKVIVQCTTPKGKPTQFVRRIDER
jgi:hypothetical protein